MNQFSISAAGSVLEANDFEVTSDSFVRAKLVLQFAGHHRLKMVHGGNAVPHVASSSAVLDFEYGSGVCGVSFNFGEVIHFKM